MAIDLLALRRQLIRQTHDDAFYFHCDYLSFEEYFEVEQQLLMWQPRELVELDTINQLLEEIDFLIGLK